MSRIVIVILIALGLAGVSIALGFIYMDFVKREGAWVEATQFGSTMSESERQAILDAWRDPGRGWAAFTAGTVGVALFGAGCVMTLFELPFFNRNPK